MTDRFKNGDTTNDHSYNRGFDQNGNVITGVDDRGTFHGGDFAGVTRAIEEGYFDNLGVNVICISAAYEQIHGYVAGDDENTSFAHYSYHGNYVLDYTETDANFGTKEEFQTLVDTAHEHGLRVVMNVVMNHAGYNTLYNMSEYGFGTLKSGWDNYYYSMANVNSEGYNSYIDYESSVDDWSKWWGSDWIRASLPGYTNSGGGNYTKSYCGLPDFKTESTNAVSIPEILKTKWTKEGRLQEKSDKYGSSQTVTNYISQWLSSWVREYGIDGFKCDTAEYVDLSSWKTLKTMCTEALREWKKAHPDKALDGETASEDIGGGSNVDTTAPTGEITAPTTFTVNAWAKTALRLQATASKTSIKLKWNAVPEADGYMIYRNKCGAKNGFKQVKVIKGGKYTNVKKLKSSISKITLKKGKTKALKITQTYAEKNKKLYVYP